MVAKSEESLSTARRSISSPQDLIKTAQRNWVKRQRTHRAPWSKPLLSDQRKKLQHGNQDRGTPKTRSIDPKILKEAAINTRTLTSWGRTKEPYVRGRGERGGRRGCVTGENCIGGGDCSVALATSCHRAIAQRRLASSCRFHCVCMLTPPPLPLS
jgi:hypothetical protein